MALSDSIYAFGKNHGVKTIAGTAVLAGGGLAASHTWRNHSNDAPEDRIGNTAATAVGGTLLGGAVIGIGAISAKQVANRAAPIAVKTIGESVRSIPGMKSMSEAFNHQGTVKEALGKLPIARHIPNPMKAWKNIGPVGRVGAIAIGSLGLAAGTKAVLGTKEYGAEDTATPDGYGSVNIASGGVKQRLNTMGASGDIVLGLHNKR